MSQSDGKRDGPSPAGNLLLPQPRGFCSGGAKAYLIADVGDIRPEWLAGHERIGITAGASTPELLVEQVVAHLRGLGRTRVEQIEIIHEDVRFALPPELGEAASARSGP